MRHERHRFECFHYIFRIYISFVCFFLLSIVSQNAVCPDSGTQFINKRKIRNEIYHSRGRYTINGTRSVRAMCSHDTRSRIVATRIWCWITNLSNVCSRAHWPQSATAHCKRCIENNNFSFAFFPFPNHTRRPVRFEARFWLSHIRLASFA